MRAAVITAAQSGARWGYRLLLVQILWVPMLYICQELSIRLGVVTGQGHGALIEEHFGKGWAWLSVGTLLLTSLSALLSEMSGLAGVGQMMYGIPAWITVAAAVIGLSWIL